MGEWGGRGKDMEKGSKSKVFDQEKKKFLIAHSNRANSDSQLQDRRKKNRPFGRHLVVVTLVEIHMKKEKFYDVLRQVKVEIQHTKTYKKQQEQF